ncbi:MAG: DeoR/GlpR family DNA-binding transcription regulator [Phycisphaerae bacterium]|nr:DeoR/GlpR family DNA-binding transcription regulator [Phycisphaerae bacterium]
MRSSAKDRQDAILAQVFEHKSVTASKLAEYLAVSEATVRRDLHALAKSGKLQLVHGGASLPENSDFSFRAKSLRNMDAKRIVGKLAASLVHDGSQIFVDSGTTCFEMVPRLKQTRGLSVIVNSARLALELDTPDIHVILLGGHYRPGRMDTVGPLACAALDQLRGYTAFVGADGLSMDFGLTASDVESAYMYRLAVANAKSVVLVADHTKFQAPSLCKIVDWKPVGKVVTDQPPTPEWMEFFREQNIEVILPQEEKQNPNI